MTAGTTAGGASHPVVPQGSPGLLDSRGPMGNSYPTGRRAWRLHSAGQPSQDGDAAQAADQGGDGADGALGKAAALQQQQQHKQQLR